VGMSTHVCGFRPPDEKWRKMKAAWDSCTQAGVDPPTEVLEFFNHEEPDPNGVEVDLGDAKSDYSADSSSGFEIDLSLIPKDVTIIRFCNSW
jgi:hypothetical protein